MSGSKSGFLIVFSIFWCHIIFTQIKGGDYLSYIKLIRKNIKLVVTLSLCLVFIIIYVQSLNPNNSSENALNPFFALALRLLHSGDIYWYAYPNNVYLNIPNGQYFSALFNDTLGLLRIQSWDTLPEAIGITFKNIHHPTDIPQGPNARHNIFGLIYYGFLGGIFFSYFLGIVLSFIRNKLPYIIRPGIFGGGIFTYFMCRGASIDTDPMLTITYLNNIVFIFPILFIGYLFVKEIFCLKKSYEK